MSLHRKLADIIKGGVFEDVSSLDSSGYEYLARASFQSDLVLLGTELDEEEDGNSYFDADDEQLLFDLPAFIMPQSLRPSSPPAPSSGQQSSTLPSELHPSVLSTQESEMALGGMVVTRMRVDPVDSTKWSVGTAEQVEELVRMSSSTEEERDRDQSPLKDRGSVASELSKVNEEQIERRKELDSYVTELKGHTGEDGAPLVDFPSDYAQLLEVMDRERLHSSSSSLTWSRYLEERLRSLPSDTDAQKRARDERLEREMSRIRELDLVLARKTREAQVVASLTASTTSSMRSRRKGSADGASSRTSSRSRRPSAAALKRSLQQEVVQEGAKFIKRNAELGPLARFYTLQPEEESRVEAILTDDRIQEGGFKAGEGFLPAADDQLRMSDIDIRLQSFVWYSPSSASSSSIAPSAPDSVVSSASCATQNHSQPNPNTNIKSSKGTLSAPPSVTPTQTTREQEDYIRQEREKREERERMRQIETKLAEIYTAPVEPLGGDELRRLLELCRTEQEQEQKRGRSVASVPSSNTSSASDVLLQEEEDAAHSLASASATGSSRPIVFDDAQYPPGHQQQQDAPTHSTPLPHSPPNASVNEHQTKSSLPTNPSPPSLCPSPSPFPSPSPTTPPPPPPSNLTRSPSPKADYRPPAKSDGIPWVGRSEDQSPSIDFTLGGTPVALASRMSLSKGMPPRPPSATKR